VPISGHPIPGPQRHKSDTMGNEVEASPERLRNHLRRPDADEDQLIMKPPLTPLIGQTLHKRRPGGTLRRTAHVLEAYDVDLRAGD
jgi:hypothetical protein